MDPLELALMTDDEATSFVGQLVTELTTARRSLEALERRVGGIRKMIDGMVELYPATEDLLPEDLEGDDQPRPRGAAAVLRVAAEAPGRYTTIAQFVDKLGERDWLPNSANPANAVRTSAERLVEQGKLGKLRTPNGVAYGTATVRRRTPRSEEEPF